MNFNRGIRATIVSSVIADIPRQFPEEVIQERFAEIVNEELLRQGPAELYEMWTTPDLRRHLSISSSNLGYYTANKRYDNDLPYCPIPAHLELGDEVRKKIGQLAREVEGERNAINQVRAGLEVELANIRTLKQFLARFPELEKYAPKSPDKNNFPLTVTNVMAGLAKLGWPKSETVAA